jgi:hypothetical protein
VAEIRDSMQRHPLRHFAAAVVVALLALAIAPGAIAARVGVLSNNYATQTAANFNANITGHTFTAVDTSVNVPVLATLLANFDELLVFEDAQFPSSYTNAPAVGNVVAAFAKTGRAVVLGTFYDQARSDASPALSPPGWGALETIDPNTTDGTGTPYAPRLLDTATLVPHPLTAGITSLYSSQWAGGNESKPGTIVVGRWVQSNARGNPDPAIAYRISDGACVIHIAIAPHYPVLGTSGPVGAPTTDFGGDFYRVWHNAFDFAAGQCITGQGNLPPTSLVAVPTLSEFGLALTVLMVVALAALSRARARRR